MPEPRGRRSVAEEPLRGHGNKTSGDVPLLLLFVIAFQGLILFLRDSCVSFQMYGCGEASGILCKVVTDLSSIVLFVFSTSDFSDHN